ncbi:MAG: metallophosphoesterase family protein [Lachnospiraceae bacterium]
MKILIVSDTHRQNEVYLKLIEENDPFDLVIHCGDGEGSELLISEAAGCEVEMVSGNNDFFSGLPKEIEKEVAGYKIWITHGHNYYVSMENATIKEEAIARGMDIVIYGHTHKPIIEREENIIALNPGSLTYPRQENRMPSYIFMELHENGKIDLEIKYIKS